MARSFGITSIIEVEDLFTRIGHSFVGRVAAAALPVKFSASRP